MGSSPRSVPMCCVTTGKFHTLLEKAPLRPWLSELRYVWGQGVSLGSVRVSIFYFSLVLKT